MRRPAHRGGGVDRHDLTRHQPVEQVADGRELLFDGGGGAGPRLPLDPGRHMQGLHGADRHHAGRRAPVEKDPDGMDIGAPSVGVADRRWSSRRRDPATRRLPDAV
jgi:hypothetical protein